jgi:hypothetical protein
MQMKALALVTIAALALATGIERTVAESGEEAQEQTFPPSETGTSAEDDITPLPPTEHEGVIEPPDVGDEGIHTDVPNPDAGHPEEVIPPSELPEQTPEPR